MSEATAGATVDRSRRTWLITSCAMGGAGAAAVAVPFVSTFQPSERAKAAGAAQAGHALAHLQVLHAFAHRAHHTGVLGTRHKRQRGLHLVLVLHDQQIRKVQARGLDLDQHLTGLGLGRGQFFPGQGVDAHGVFAEPGMHGVSSVKWS